MIYEDNIDLKKALEANLYNIINSLLNTAKNYKDTPLNIPRRDTALLIIALELHNISETLKSIDKKIS